VRQRTTPLNSVVVRDFVEQIGRKLVVQLASAGRFYFCVLLQSVFTQNNYRLRGWSCPGSCRPIPRNRWLADDPISDSGSHV
jgi:hypothetical protein